MSEQKISPCLWFDDRIEQAVNFYISVFGGRITARSSYWEGGPRPQGTPLTISFELAGQEVLALNGGPNFQFTEAISLFVKCEDQEEIDRYWRLLISEGGEESQCGWLKDRYGLSWQIAPKQIIPMLSNGDPAIVARVMQAVMGMRKLELAAIERAYAG